MRSRVAKLAAGRKAFLPEEKPQKHQAGTSYANNPKPTNN
jgi:hypothetical protein